MNYNEIVQERLEGLEYMIESYESVVLEAFKEKKNANQEKAARSFLSFLKKKHPDKHKQAKENPKALKKFVNEYRQWAKEHPNAYSLIYSGISGVQSIKNMYKSPTQAIMSAVMLAICEKLLRGDIDLNKEAERVAKEKKKAKAAKKKEKEAAKKAKKALKESYEFDDELVFLEEGYEEEIEEDDDILEEEYAPEGEDAVVFLEEGYEEEIEEDEEVVEESSEIEEDEDYLDLTE